MGRRGREGTPRVEAELLSAMRGSALGALSDDDFGDDEDDSHLLDLNNPDVQPLGEPPLIGGRPHTAELFGETAQTIGRATSPKLWSSASQFPQATQFRVWRMENGTPVGLGQIDIEATEEDFVRSFRDAMPQPGQGKFTFVLRPVSMRGKELGQEILQHISEHHATLRQIRDAERRAKEEGIPGLGGQSGFGRGGGDVIVQGGGTDGSGAYFAEEMGRMFESAVEMRDEQTRILQAQLEAERDRERQLHDQLAQERISTAERSASVVEKMTEKLMATDQARAKEALESQRETSQVVLTTLTTTFQQQQEALRLQAERDKERERERQEQERNFFERQRQEMELRRQQEREEAERRRREEREEWDRRIQMERQEAEIKRERERQELEHRREQLRLEAEQRRLEIEERRRQEQMDWERKQVQFREEIDRKERLDRERWEREKLELQSRSEKERLEWEQKREEMRREDERRERERREELERREQQRREEIVLQQKQMEVAAQRDREHSERMMEMARLEREAQREAQLAREKAERESREHADAERQRRHELMLREMELQKERDREHAERMLQMSKIQNSGGLSGITEMLGMETPELLGRIFGGGSGEGGEGWSDAIPKVLGGLGELAKVAMATRTAAPVDPRAAARAQVVEPTQHGRTRARAEQKMVAVQTPQGVRLIPANQLSELERQQLDAMTQEGVSPVPVQVGVGDIDLPAAPYRPPQFAEEDARERESKIESKTEVKSEPVSEFEQKLAAAREVNAVKRATEAGLSLKDQKSARRAIRDLVAKLRKANEDEWPTLVTAALTTNVGIFHYLRAVTVLVALVEVNAEAELSERIVKALQESGMVPEGVMPFDEDDYVKMSAEGSDLDGEIDALLSGIGTDKGDES